MTFSDAQRSINRTFNGADIRPEVRQKLKPLLRTVVNNGYVSFRVARPAGTPITVNLDVDLKLRWVELVRLSPREFPNKIVSAEDLALVREELDKYLTRDK